tara:strand:- start:112 stop:504 length:393 start_codon:yes stop_codon:yes gene_type:complete
MSTAMSASSMAMSAAAQAQADEAKKTACVNFMGDYTNDFSNVDLMRVYADCVGFLYPAELTGSSIIMLKVVLCIAFIGGALGVQYARKSGMWSGAVDYGMLFLMGFIFTPLITLILVALVYGLGWIVGVV